MKITNTITKKVLAFASALTMAFTLSATTFRQVSMTASAAEYTLTFPVNNGCKVAYYQQYDPNYKNHDGLDIHASKDKTIYAAKGGKVVSVGDACPHESLGFSHSSKKYGEAGNYICIKGTDGKYYWYYHLKQHSMLVSKNDKVVEGQALATMGSSGCSTGTHLHFKITSSSGYYSKSVLANPNGKYKGTVKYINGPYNTTPSRIIVRFNRNFDSKDKTAVHETFNAGTANQKFGYKPDGKGRYKKMEKDGFGQWMKTTKDKNGNTVKYKLLGWSTDKKASKASWTSYSAVSNGWIEKNKSYIELYAVWKKV